MRPSLAARGRLLVAAALCAAVAVSGQEFTRTQISDTLFNADGSRAVGSMRISWKSFTGADGSTVAKNSVDMDIVDGIVSVALAPNLGAVPDGTYYSVEYRLHKGERSNELWIVPQSGGAVSIADVRVLSVPSASMSVSLVQVNGLSAELDAKADKATTNTFLAPQVLREDAPGTSNPLLGLQKNDGAAGVFFRLPELSGDIIYTLPPTAGSSNQSVTTDGSGALSWSSVEGGNSGDAITVNASEVDTTANLDDTSTVAWTLADGGGEGPDDLQASVVANSIGPEQIDETATYDFSGGGMTLPSGVAIGSGTTPFNLTGYSDDAAPSAPGATNQFTMDVDRSSGLLSWILNGGSAQAALTVTAQNAGTDVTADLEEETHASEHAENAADELLVENLGTACDSGEAAVSDGSGGLNCAEVSGGVGTLSGDGTANYVPIYTASQVLAPSDAVFLGSGSQLSFVLRPSLNTVETPNADLILATGSTQANTITGAGFLRGIFGGYDNTIGANSASNIFGSHHSTISGDATHALLIGGSTLQIQDGDYAVVAGGSTSTITTGDYAAILGGRAVTVTGSYGVAIGADNSAIGSGRNVIIGARDSSIAGGSFTFMGPVDASSSINIAGSHACIVTGSGQSVTGDYGCILSGIDNDVSGSYSVVLNGQSNTASGQYSTVLNGNNAIASGATALASAGGTASGDNTVAVGPGVLARSYGETAFGLNPTDYTPDSTSAFDNDDRLFVIGNGTTTGNRKNAFTMLKNGFVGYGIDVPQRVSHIKYVEPYLRFDHNDTSYPNSAIEVLGGIEWYGNDTSGAGVMAAIKGISTENDDLAGGLSFFTTTDPAGAGIVESMRLIETGRLTLATGQLAFGTIDAPDTGLAREAAGVARISNGTTGYGRIALDDTTPSAATDACTARSFWSDGTYVYYCVASGNIVRSAAMATW